MVTWAEGYGLGVLALAAIAWFSRDRTTRILLIAVGQEWAIYNAAVGDDRWWAGNPATIATVAIAVAIMARFLPVNRLTLTLMALYTISMLLAVSAAFAGVTQARWYFDLINGTFALRLLTVGGWGVWCAVRRKRLVGSDRALLFHQGRATFSRRRAF